MHQLARECTQDHFRQELPNEDISSSGLQNNCSLNTQDCPPKCVTNGHKHARTNGSVEYRAKNKKYIVSVLFV